MRSLVTSIGTHTADLQRRIQAMEMKCYRKILHISYKDCVTNKEVRAKIQQAIGPQEDHLTIVKRRGERGKKTRQTEQEMRRRHQGKSVENREKWGNWL